MDDQTLGQQLRALEDQVVVTGGRPLVQRSRGPRVRTGIVAVIATVLIAGGAAAAGGVFNAVGRPGAFDSGQPLHCKGVAAMTPRAADRWLRGHGYVVTWQVEDRTPGVPKGQQGSYQSATPPAIGLIAAAVITDPGRHELIVVVETGAGARGTDDCQ